MAEPTSCCVVPGSYCARVDALFNMPGVHVIDVGWRLLSKGGEQRLVLTVETGPAAVGCPGCGVPGTGHGRRVRRLHDIPAFGAPVELVWRARRYRCAEPACVVDGFTEHHELAGPRAKLTARATWWATAASGPIPRQSLRWHVGSGRTGTPCGTGSPRLVELADDPARLAGVQVLGVD